MSREEIRGIALATTLADRAAAKSSGILEATRGKLRRLFCLQQGWLVYAASNLVEEQFAEYLVMKGFLSPADRAAAIQEAQRARKPMVRIVADHGMVSAEKLRQAMEGHVTSLLSSCIEWPDGSFRFNPGIPNLKDEVTVRLSAVHLLLAHARRHPASLDRVRVRIGPPDARPACHPDRAEAAVSMQLDSVGQYLLERCDGTHGISALLEHSPGDEEATLRGLYGLLLANLLQVGGGIRKGAAPAINAPLGREECIAQFGVPADADHYAILGLDHTADAARIRAAYYRLARRYHPDRFRSGDLTGLLSEAEGFFTRVTEAYNTLSDEKQREEYDRQITSAAPQATEQTDTHYLARQNYLRGRALAERRRFTEAITFLENAVRLQDGEPSYQLELGTVLSRNPRQRAQAERHLLRAAELDPARAGAYLALARLYRRAGRGPEAAAMFREALRWEPSNAEAQAALGEMGNVPPADPGTLRGGLFQG